MRLIDADDLIDRAVNRKRDDCWDYTPQDTVDFIEYIKRQPTATDRMLIDAIVDMQIKGEIPDSIEYRTEIKPDVKSRIMVDIDDRRSCFCGGMLSNWRQ